MRRPLSIDEVEEIEFEATTPDGRRRLAARLAAWAEERHPDDDEGVTPALLLVKAGELLDLAGDQPASVDMYRRAVAADGSVSPDVRCYLHAGLVKIGDADGARRVADEVRHSKPTDLDVYIFIAESYEMVEDLAQANRWMNLGLRQLLAAADEDDDFTDPRTRWLLLARRRVRAALGFAPDEFDELVDLPPVLE